MKKHPILYSLFFISLLLVFFSTVFISIFSIFSGSPPLIFEGGEVAILPIEGPIFESNEIMEQIDDIRENKSIKALVVRIDSPGGAVAPSQEIFEELKKARATRKVVVSMGTVAASGGYYIASAADKIFASRGTITGSIGVIMKGMNMEQLVKWAKLEPRVFKSGKFKDSGSPFRSLDPEEKAYLQGLIDNMYAQFKKTVSEQRKLPLEKVDQLAEGKVYTGEQAYALGLVDHLGTLYDAIDEAKKLAGLPPEARVIWPKKFESPFEWIFEKRKNLAEHFFSGLNFGTASLGTVSLPLWLYSIEMEESL